VDEIINEWLSTNFVSDKEGGADSAAPETVSREGGERSFGAGAVPQREMFNAVCWNCTAETQIPFQPDPKRAVYCKNCLKLIQAGKILPPTRPRGGNVEVPMPTQQRVKPPIPPTPRETPIVHREAPIARVSEQPVRTQPQPSYLDTILKQSPPREERKFAPPKKEVNLEELKKAIEESLKSVK